MKQAIPVLLFMAIIGQAVLVQFEPGPFVADDSLFYLQIAQNIANGQGSTFNQIMPTNGYHPLWALALTTLAIFFDDTWLFFRGSLALSSMLLAAAVYLLINLLHTLKVRFAWVSGAALLMLLGSLGVYLSEAHLLAFTTLLLFNALIQVPKRQTVSFHIYLGGLIGLVFLSRLDTIFLLIVVGLYVLFVYRKPKPVICVGGAAFLLVLPYLIWNLTTFGHLTPISGAIHSCFPQIVWNTAAPGVAGWILMLVAISGGLLVLVHPNQLLRHLYLILLSGASLQMIYVVFFTSSGTRYHWYWTILMLLSAITVSISFELLSRTQFISPVTTRFSSSKLLKLCLAAMIVFGLAFPLLLLRTTRGGDLPPRLIAPLWLDELLEPGQIIAVDDNPGEIALWSQLRVLPLDGLVADYDFQDKLLTHQVTNTLAAYEVCYYVDTGGGIAVTNRSLNPFTEDYMTYDVSVRSTLHRQAAGTLSLSRENEIGRIWIGAPSIEYAIVWRLHESCP